MASIPQKYRNFLAAITGGFVLCEQISKTRKVQFEIVRMLYHDQQMFYIENNVWPKEFLKDVKVQRVCDKIKRREEGYGNASKAPDSDDEDSSDDNMCGFQKQENVFSLWRPYIPASDSETSDED